MSWAAAATVGGSVLSGALGGGGGGAAPAPINNTANFGDVSFGAKYIGSDAVAAAPTIITTQNPSWTKYIPWVVGGLVTLVALVALTLFARPPRRQK